MDRDEDSPTPADDEATPSSTRPSGSRWEPREDTGAPEDAAGDGTATDADPGAAPRSRRRGVRVAAGLGAAVLLAGGGFGVGFAVGDGGPDGGRGGGPGLSRHHRDHDGDASGRPRSQAPAGGNTSGSSSPILGGLFT